MKCKDVSAKIDLKEIPKGLYGRFRFWVHIQLCRACKNYLEFSRALSKATKNYAKTTVSNEDVDKINQNLLKKFSK
jgi:hypothetical protein